MPYLTVLEYSPCKTAYTHALLPADEPMDVSVAAAPTREWNAAMVCGRRIGSTYRIPAPRWETPENTVHMLENTVKTPGPLLTTP